MSVLDARLEKLAALLERFGDIGVMNRIAGEDRPGSAGLFATTSPTNKSHIADVAHGTEEDIDAAAKAAQAAFHH